MYKGGSNIDIRMMFSEDDRYCQKMPNASYIHGCTIKYIHHVTIWIVLNVKPLSSQVLSLTILDYP